MLMFQSLSNFINTHHMLILCIGGTALIGLTAGILGVFVLLRRQSLLGDAISHAALPGIAGALLLTRSNNSAVLSMGGVITACLGVALLFFIKRNSTLKMDTILGIILSTFFGFGLLLFSIAQKYPLPPQSFLHKFFFGSATTLLISDIYCIASVTLSILMVILLFWKEFVLLSFDPLHMNSVGYSHTIFEYGMTFLLIITTIVGLQTIGIILMSSMLIAPAATALQWSRTLLHAVIIAACIGVFSCIVGCLLSSSIDHMPTGPIIVVVANLVLFFSFMFAPKKIKAFKNE